MGRTRRPATDEEARALASALRLRILRVCLGESHTNQEIARAVGRDPASILHHVRRLVDTGFLIAEPARRGTRGSREIPYLATGKSWQIETPAKGKVLLQAFLEEVALVSATDLDTARLGLRLGPEDLAEFKDRLADLLDAFERRPDDPAAAAISVFVAIHPDVTRAALAAHSPRRPRDPSPDDQRAAVPST